MFSGENKMEQIASIMEVCGYPPSDLLDNCKLKDVYFTEENVPRYITVENYCPGSSQIVGYSEKKKPWMEPGSRDIAAFIGDTDQNLINFIMRCLTWHPHQRLSVFQALNHPWLKETLTEPLFNENYPFRVRRQFSIKHKVRNRYRDPAKNDLITHPAPKQSKSDTTIKTCIPILPELKSLSVD